MNDTNNDKGYVAPTDVHQGKFPVDESNLVYTNMESNYSVAVSSYDGGKQMLGIRWNEKKIGFPQTFGRPVWMMIPPEFAMPILCSLLNLHNENNPVDTNKVKEAIEKILSN